MSKTAVIQKINQMPDNLMGIVAEMLDKLMQGYELGRQEEWEEFTEEELAEFDRRFEESVGDPAAQMEWKDIRQQIRAKYGV